MRKPVFYICENKGADQLRSKCAADQRLCFRYIIVQSLYFQNPKGQAYYHFLKLYSPVCVGPDRKLRRQVSHDAVQYISAGASGQS